MSAELIDPAAVEQDRRKRLEELGDEEAPGWQERFQPGSMGCHELLDRTSVTIHQVERFVLEHPACVANPEWYALAGQAVALLSELYQRVGAAHLGTDAGPAESAGRFSPGAG